MILEGIMEEDASPPPFGPRPITKLPENEGDSVEFRDVDCPHCKSRVVLAINRVCVDGKMRIRAELPLCCDRAVQTARDFANVVDNAPPCE